MTTFKMMFDFTSAEQKKVLQELQAQGYTLLAYKGAYGPNQISVGVPTWFSVPFGNMFGVADISYTPTYKVFVSSQSEIAVNTTLLMTSLSGETPLGSALTFNPDGSFVSGGVQNVPVDSLGLKNNRPAGSPALTVGLAGLVQLPTGQQFLPFCAFTLAPQNSIIMTPKEQILMVAARTNLQSGNVQANVSAPGATFSFSASAVEYDLMVTASTFKITNLPGTPAVMGIDSGAAIGPIVNPKS